MTSRPSRKPIKSKYSKTQILDAVAAASELSRKQVARDLEKITASDITAAQLKAVAEPWLNQAPVAAAWVASQPEGEASNEAMSGVMWRWKTSDEGGSACPISRHRDGPSRLTTCSLRR